MLVIPAMTVTQLPVWVAQRCRDGLCWEGSEMQGLFDRMVQRSLTIVERSWRIAYARVQQDYFDDDEIEVVGWASLTEWKVGEEVRLQLQGFVDEKHRGKGIATAMVVALTHDMPIHPLPIAVFSDEFFSIALRRGWNATQYKHVDDGWIATRTATAEGRDSGRGADQGRVHADARQVRRVSLARKKAGEET